MKKGEIILPEWRFFYAVLLSTSIELLGFSDFGTVTDEYLANFKLTWFINGKKTLQEVDEGFSV